MFDLDPITESPSSGGRAPPARIARPLLHPQFDAAKGCFVYGQLFGVAFWIVLAIVACAVL